MAPETPDGPDFGPFYVVPVFSRLQCHLFFFDRIPIKRTYLALEMAKQNRRLGMRTPLQRARLVREGLIQKGRLEMGMAILRTREANDRVSPARELYNAANVAGCHHENQGMNFHGAPFPSYPAFQTGLFRKVGMKPGRQEVGSDRWCKGL